MSAPPVVPPSVLSSIGTQDGEHFDTLFDFLPVGAYRTRPDGVMVRANPALVRLNGFADEAEQLACVSDIAGQWYVQPGRRAEFQRTLEAEDRVVGFESEVYRYKARERIWISENAHLVRGADGQPLYYEGTVEEITDRVRERAALQRSEQQLRVITQQLPGAVYRVLIEPDGRRVIDYLSEGVHALFGVGPEQALRDNRMLARFRHPDDFDRIEGELAAATAACGPLTIEYRIVAADGTEKWVQQTSVAGAPEGAAQVRIGVMLDVTERKRAEAALLRNSELWKLALEATGDGVWDWRVQEGRELLSPQCKALYGFEPHELPDTPDALDARTHPDDLAGMHAAREAHFAGLAPTYVNELRVQCKDGRWKWILTRGMVLERDAAGRPLRMIGTHTDITARKQAEDLRLQRDLAAAADRAKSLFLSRVSHELRTPLNAILGFSQLLELQLPAGTREQQWLQQVLGSGRHLLALMDDILDLSSAQTGQLPIALVAVPLAPLLEEARSMLAGAAQDAGVDVALHMPADGLPTPRADRKRLLQIVTNLLGNAIKYNRRGGWVQVVVRGVARAGDDDGHGGGVEIDVIDNGPGLDPEQLSRLFQPFERVGAQRGPVAGTGLGLSLSREFAQAMGGSLTVASRPGAGSTFRLRLPVEPPHLPSQTSGQAPG